MPGFVPGLTDFVIALLHHTLWVSQVVASSEVIVPYRGTSIIGPSAATKDLHELQESVQERLKIQTKINSNFNRIDIVTPTFFWNGIQLA